MFLSAYREACAGVARVNGISGEDDRVANFVRNGLARRLQPTSQLFNAVRKSKRDSTVLVHCLECKLGGLLRVKGKVLPERSRRFALASESEVPFGSGEPMLRASRNGIIRRHDTTPCPLSARCG